MARDGRWRALLLGLWGVAWLAPAHADEPSQQELQQLCEQILKEQVLIRALSARRADLLAEIVAAEKRTEVARASTEPPPPAEHQVH